MITMNKKVPMIIIKFNRPATNKTRFKVKVCLA